MLDSELPTEVLPTILFDPSSVEQVQSDWYIEDVEDPAFIKNKPEVGDQQVQSDWEEIDTADPAFILNKPGTELFEKATGAEINTGSNDTKYATPKAINDSNVLGLKKLVK